MHPSTRTALLAPSLAALAVLGACSRHQPGQEMPAMPPTPVTTATVTPTDVPVTFEYLGRTEGSREVEIRARVSGFLDSRHFVEGTDVAQGALLFQLDQRTLLAQKATAAAEVTAAEARIAQATREATRLQPLVAEQAVSQRDYDDAESARLIATADLAAAAARLQQIEVDLGYTRVTAPIAGRIGRALRPEGSLVAPTADGLLTTLLQLDPIYVHFHRSELQQQNLERDLQTQRLALPANGQFDVEVQHRDGTVLASGGTIDFVDGRLDTATGTIPLRAALQNPQLRLRAGQSVKVVLRGAVLKQAITVPQRAVLEGAQGKMVMLAGSSADGSMVATARPIEVGEWVDLPTAGPASRSWVVTKGLAAGERVILDNLVRLRPGSPVSLATPAAAGTPDAKPTSNGR